MDPDTALAIVRDDTADLDMRREAAYGLADWVQRDGYLPAGFTSKGEVMATLAPFLGKMRFPLCFACLSKADDDVFDRHLDGPCEADCFVCHRPTRQRATFARPQ